MNKINKLSIAPMMDWIYFSIKSNTYLQLRANPVHSAFVKSRICSQFRPANAPERADNDIFGPIHRGAA